MPRRITASRPVRRQAGAVTAILSAALCAGALITPTPASAAGDVDPPDVVSVELGTEQVVVPATGSAEVPVTVHLSDPQGVAHAMVSAMPDHFLDVLLNPKNEPKTGDDLADLMALVPSPVPLRLVAGTAYDGTWAGTIRIRHTNLAGPYTVALTAMDRNENFAGSPEVGTFQARYRTRARADFSPATVAPGSALTVSGHLGRVTATGWAPFAHRQVAVQFRPAGSERWVTKGTLVTGADGTFANASRFHAHRDGDWRVQFIGGRTHAPSASAADMVTVS